MGVETTLRTTHTVEDVLRTRVLAIACSNPDGNDLDSTLREIIRLTYALIDIWCGSYARRRAWPPGDCGMECSLR